MDDDGERWVVPVSEDLVLEVLLVSGRAWGFWTWRGELVGEADVGQG